MRDVLWLKLVKRVEPYENRYKKTIKKLFRDQQKRLFSGMGIKGMYIPFDVKEETGIFLDSLMPIYDDAVIYEGMLALQELGIDATFQITKPNVMLFFQKVKLTQEQIQSHTLGLLKSTINEGVQNNESILELEKRIKLVFDNASTFRAESIARTEVNRSANFARLEGFDQSGIVKKKEWLATRDSRTRNGSNSDFDHLSADGQQVKMFDKFTISGERLSYPADQEGSAGNTINCRCRVLPVLD